MAVPHVDFDMTEHDSQGGCDVWRVEGWRVRGCRCWWTLLCGAASVSLLTGDKV